MKNKKVDIWDAYNTLLLDKDLSRLTKILVRYDLFKKVKNLPGDIIECGVFKGSGLMFWLQRSSFSKNLSQTDLRQ